MISKDLIAFKSGFVSEDLAKAILTNPSLLIEAESSELKSISLKVAAEGVPATATEASVLRFCEYQYLPTP